MRIGLIGYGKMGKLIGGICLERGHSIPLIVDPYADSAPENASVYSSVQQADFSTADVVIDFSLPTTILDNIRVYAERSVAAVIGTTGWESSRDEVAELIESSKGSLMFGSNFSVGANIFFHVTGELTRLINKFPQYDMMLHEFHHNRKQDSPSGTAIRTAEQILENLERKTHIQTETMHRSIEANELHVTSSRGGDIPGLHMVLADSTEDTIELRHTARSRRGFALGSVLGAEWLHGKQGFFSFDQYFAQLLKTI